MAHIDNDDDSSWTLVTYPSKTRAEARERSKRRARILNTPPSPWVAGGYQKHTLIESLLKEVGPLPGMEDGFELPSSSFVPASDKRYCYISFADSAAEFRRHVWIHELASCSCPKHFEVLKYKWKKLPTREEQVGFLNGVAVAKDYEDSWNAERRLYPLRT